MATWRIYSNLRTTYTDPRVQDGAEQECGKPENPSICKFDDVLDWAARQGDAGDLVMTSRGFFYLSGAPGIH